METIRVNMTPCEDIKTIHASQNDGEAREWGFILHNNGDVIDSSEITDQMVFKAYEGGTEQILPENGAVPVTAPFVGDIKYPDTTRTGQEFLYRESPTEEDGLAFIESIKGNTLNWNQIYNVNSNRSAYGVNIKVVDGAVSITGTSNNIGTGPVFAWTDFKGVLGHKYIITKDFALPSGDLIFDQYNLNSSTDITTVVFTLTSSAEYIIPQLRIAQTGVTYNISGHLCVYDLTKMFGSGNEPTTVEEFTSLFPLPYYAYNQGTLLSFMGNGIKTVGKNLLNLNIADGTYLGLTVKKEDDGSVSINGRTTSSGSIYLMDNTGNDFYVPNDAVLSTNVVSHGEYDVKLTTLENTSAVTIGNESLSVNVPKGWYKGLRLYFANGRDYNLNHKLMIAFNSTEFEPYTSSTLSLPISTYFPTGMKSAGSVYDELTETKASVRLKKDTFSSVSAFDSSGKLGNLGDATDVVNITSGNVVPNDKSVFETYSLSGLRNNDVNGITQFGTNFYVRLQGKTTLAEYNTYLSANPLTIIYELATPIETEVTTASLVTENAEIPLFNEDGVLVGKCNSDVSADAGFIEGKIKLADTDGECYSNKIQLHIERSPQ